MPENARFCRNFPENAGKFQILPPAWQNLENAGIFPTLFQVSLTWLGFRARVRLWV